MTDRIVIVPQNSEILQHSSTEQLHIYNNGETLVRTATPLTESGTDLEIPVNQGVQLHDVDPEDINRARTALNSLADTDWISAYVELIGPVDPDWLATLKTIGIQPVQYHPEHSYLCQGTVAAFKQALALYFVLDVVPLIDIIKPKTKMPEDGEKAVWVVVQGTREQASAILGELAAIPDVKIDPNQEIDAVDFYLRIRATVTADGQNNLLHHPGVLGVEPYEPPVTEDEVAGLILAGQYDATGKPNGSYLRWLEDKGLNGEGVTIGIVDAGVDELHPAFSARIKDLNNGKKSWHGTFVAGHAAGCYLQEKDGNQFIYGLGMAPQANLLIQDNQRSATALCQETVTEKAPSGVVGTVQNNSWGAGTSDPMTYGSQEATYDKLVRNSNPDSSVPKPLTICFSAGNSGTSGLTRPKAAKNIIITGNSENYRPDVGKDQSDNINEVYTGPHGSSYGNCGDGRIAPHVVAPGEWTASANYDSHPGEREYISPKLTWGGGTSAASPKTAGACALLIQWWRRHNNGIDPSPAMLRSLIVNGAEPMRSGGSIPNKIQGWGRLNLENILSDVRRTYVDQTVMLRRRAEQKTWKIRVFDPQKPVKITLSWTDPPASLGSGTQKASAIVNKLALRVDLNGRLYRGNQFQNGWSYPDGTPDREGWDNLQNIYLQAGMATETLQVSVTALEITTNCLTGQIDTPQQDFALVITNGSLDDGSTPATVLVAADQADQSGTKPDKPTGYWANGAGNSDATELDAQWWQQTMAGSQVQPSQPTDNNSPPSSPDTTASNVDAWWLQDDVVWSKPESDRQPPSPTQNQLHLAQTLQAGIEILASAGHQVVLANGKEGSTRGEEETTYRQSSYTLSPAPPLPISDALAQLMKNWESFGISPATPEKIARRVGVLVVGAGTRISHVDLLAMRRLAFFGQLFLVSDDAQILAFLAQRIHCRLGVQFRLAEDTHSLATLLQDTLIEASGAHQVEVAKTSDTANGIIVSRYQFHVVAADSHLTIRIQFPPYQPLLRVDLRRPNQPPLTLGTQTPPVGIKVLPGTGSVQINLDATTQNWAGQWEIQLQQQGQTNLNGVKVWAWGDLQFRLQKQELPNTSEATQDGSESLMALSSTSGATLSRLQSQPRTISSFPIAQEAVRNIDEQVEALRVGQEGRTSEATQAVQSPTMSALVRTPQAVEGATVIDLPMRAEGTDASGCSFTRLFRHNFIRLEPRSCWRQRLAQQESMIFISAQVTAVQYSDNKVVGLRLQKGNRQRQVTIATASLSTQLAQIKLHDLQAKDLIFGVIGRKLYGIYRPLSNLKSRHIISQGPGIEAAIPEPALPTQEATNTDYPLTSRFVPAKAYRSVNSPRTINRIVIHITDGSSSIAGTISWFQNPQSGVSAHYIIGQDGEVVQMVRDNNIAFHANSANGDSIGIEHCARSPGAFKSTDPGLYPTAIQYASSAALVNWLCTQYNIPIDRDHILGHAEADPNTTHRNCPNAVWDWDYFMSMVTSATSQPPPAESGNESNQG